MQLVRANADDVDFSTPNAVDPANDFLTGVDGALPDPPGLGRHLRLRPAQRLRAAEGGARREDPARGRPHEPALVLAAARRTAPSTCAGTWPRRRAGVLATASSGPPACSRRRTRPPTPGTSSAAKQHLHRRDRRAPRDARPRVGRRRAAAARRARRPIPPPAAPTRRSSACASASSSPPRAAPTDGLVGESQKQVFVHDDPDLVAGMPARRSRARARRARSSPTSCPAAARRWCSPPTTGASTCCAPTGPTSPGFPVRTRPVSWWVNGPTAQADDIGAARGAIGVGAPGDRRPERRRLARHRGRRPRGPRVRVGPLRPRAARVRPRAHEPGVLAGLAGRPGLQQPHQARLRRLARRPPTSTATTSPSSSAPRWTATSTPGTATARRWPASRCSSSTRTRCRRSTRRRTRSRSRPTAACGDGGELVTHAGGGRPQRRRPARDRGRRAGGVRRAVQRAGVRRDRRARRATRAST